MPWIWSALMPHPPVLVPEVGMGREMEASATTRGCDSLTSSVAGQIPDVLLILSPHQPYARGALFLNTAQRFHGSFAPFGAPDVELDPVTSQSGAEELAAFIARSGIQVREGSLPDLTKDQGSMVPLYFLRREWRELPAVVITSPIGLTPELAFEMGRSLSKFDGGGLRWAMLASGDLSHRLTPDAPSGYEPVDGPAFEAAVDDALRSCSPRPLTSLGPARVERAGECGFRSVMAMLGLASGSGAQAGDIEIFSHEGPFGVGYCYALWRADAGDKREDVFAPVRLARETVSRLLDGKPLPESGSGIAASPLWKKRCGCFVSIKKKNGDLRGCIGTLSPAWPSLDREIIENAVLASTRDPRFPPMTRSELDDAVFSVDVLSEAEPVDGVEQLDPKEYGVIVSKGCQRGVLLPDLEGVDTAEQQVAIAARKAGLSSPAGAKLERFRVERYRERD